MAKLVQLKTCWVWQYTLVTLALGRLRQNSHEFEDSLGYTVRIRLAMDM